MRNPDFFLIGAPKCGTTALASWLSRNPGILIGNPKEPNYYSYLAGSIMPHMATARTRDEYLRLFEAAEPNQLIGEASTTYLRSPESIRLLMNDNPAARLLVCLRNPLERVLSGHAQRLQMGLESERDFANAWSKSKSVYIEACSAGRQIERILQYVPRQQIFFVLNEDMRRSPRSVYQSVLRFLRVPDDGQNVFRSSNQRAIPRSLALARLLLEYNKIKSRFGITRSFGIGRHLSPLIKRPPRPEELVLSPVLRIEILNTFRDDIELLQELIQRDLGHWVKETPENPARPRDNGAVITGLD